MEKLKGTRYSDEEGAIQARHHARTFMTYLSRLLHMTRFRSHPTHRLGYSLLLLALTSLPSTGIADEAWRLVAEDLEVREVTASTSTFFSAKIVFVRTALRKFSVGVVNASDFGQVRTDVKTLVKLSKAAVGINANFFDERGNPLGLVISRAIIQRKLHKGGKTLTGIFQASRQGLSVVGRDDFSPNSVVEAVQAGPRLLIQGQKTKGVDNAAYSRRAGVCIDKEGKLLLFCASSGLMGLTIGQLQSLLLRDDIGCYDALNFDGGGSAQLYLSNKISNSDTRPTPTRDSEAPPTPEEDRAGATELHIEGTDEVPVIVALFPK